MIYQTMGRLVLILDDELHPASSHTLKNLLSRWATQREPTFLASLSPRSRVAALRADDGRIFYNTIDDLPLHDTMELLPWREIWLLNQGRLWQGLPPS